MDTGKISKDIQTQWAGRSIAFFEEIDSTNMMAGALAEQGAPAGTLVLAECQTVGKGRRGRQWFSPAGTGIWMTLLLRPGLPAEQISAITLVAALSVGRAVRHVTGLETGIKWPNDVLCRGKKLCGILLEMGGNTEKLDYIVVGMGINANHSEYPEELRDIATSVKLEIGQTADRCRLIARILDELEDLSELCTTDGGYRSLMEEYKKNSATLGKLVNVIGVNETITGVVEDFDELGCIVLRMEDGSVKRIGSGDVSVRNA